MLAQTLLQSLQTYVESGDESAVPERIDIAAMAQTQIDNACDRGAAVVWGIEQVAAGEVTPLLVPPPPPHARPWVVLRADVSSRTGQVSVDPGDGTLHGVMDLTVLRLYGPRPAGERPDRCPRCDEPRVRRHTAFDLCPDCGWSHQPQLVS